MRPSVRSVGVTTLAIVLALAIVACGSTSTASPPPSSFPAIAHYDGDDVAFDYPGTWGRASFPVVSSFSNVLPKPKLPRTFGNTIAIPISLRK